MNNKECMIIDFFANLSMNIKDIEPSIDNASLTEMVELVESDLSNNMIYLNEYLANEKYDYLSIFEKLVGKHLKGYRWYDNFSIIF